MSEEGLHFPDSLDPEALERRYRALRSKKDRAAFARAVEARYRQEPDNPLLAAWHIRLRWDEQEAKETGIPWKWVLPVALLNGFLLWMLSDERTGVRLPGDTYPYMPYLFLYWMPVTAVLVLVFLAGVGDKRWRRVGYAAAFLTVMSLYVRLAYTYIPLRVVAQQYVHLAVLHLPIVALSAVGYYILSGRDYPAQRFALLQKVLETTFVAGLFVLVGSVFASIAGGLFSLFPVSFPVWLLRLAVVGGAGLIPVVATALVYDPRRSPAEQLDGGMSPIVRRLLQIIVPLSGMVLAVYAGFIPFYAREPLYHREALIVYTAMLFAVVVLLLGSTPTDEEADKAAWLRWGVIGLTALALLVGLYALSVILYRTWRGSLTPHRMAFIGWDILNLTLLGWLLLVVWRQRAGSSWARAAQGVFAKGATPYAVWAIAVLLVVPLWFGRGVDPAYAHLPESVLEAIYGKGYPVLLKCYGSPHIYLLERGQKRWVKDIPTFEREGFRWEDVREVPCEDLRRIPDGPPIPPDAGTPPVPYGPGEALPAR